MEMNELLQLVEENKRASEKKPENTARVIRRRARRACVECHKRKVRCDVLSRGQSCTNCRLDGLSCVVRSKDGRERSQFIPADAVEEDKSEVTPPQDQSADSDSLNHTPPSIETCDPAFPFRHPRSSVSFFGKTYTAANGNIDVMFSYYSFLAAEPVSHIPLEDFKFLEQKGCFHLPSRSVLDEFIQQYFLYVHPLLPLLDENQFWEMYLADDRSQQRRMPLFLFRAILFVSCGFVATETLKFMGFQDPLDARTTLYRRCKLLFDFNATSDPIAISQAALLLTYYCSDLETIVNTTWLRTAIQYATTENVHLYSQDSSLTLEDRMVRKRLWWCIILRDRILPLGLRRPIHITHDIFDFKQDPLCEHDLESEFNTSQVYDSETKRALARILMCERDLAVILTDIISIVYPVNSIKAFDFNLLMQMPVMIRKCKDDLDRWSSSFKGSLSITGSTSTRHSSIILFNGLVQIYYHSARAALCQYESLAIQANVAADESSTRAKEIGSELHSAIASISNIVSKLVEINIAKYLPVSAVAYMALPIILNSIDLQGTRATTFKNESKRRQLRSYNEAMEMCRQRYTGTNAASDVINRAIAAAKENSLSKRPILQSSTSMALLRASTEDIGDWFDIFVSKPREYLQIALTVDFSLCTGRYPQRDDLPRLLLVSDSASTTQSIPRSLSPVMADLCGAEMELVTPESMAVSGRRLDLDFFDFGTTLEKGIRSSETSSWNDNLTDDILEDILHSTSLSF